MSYAYTYFDDQGPIYVGKGTGARWTAHLSRPEFREGRKQLFVVIDLCDNESEALDMEASIYGALKGSGRLINKVRPNGGRGHETRWRSPPEWWAESCDLRHRLRAAFNPFSEEREYTAKWKQTAQGKRNDLYLALHVIKTRVSCRPELQPMLDAYVAKAKVDIRRKLAQIDQRQEDALACLKLLYQEVRKSGGERYLSASRTKVKLKESETWAYSGCSPVLFSYLTTGAWRKLKHEDVVPGMRGGVRQ